MKVLALEMYLPYVLLESGNLARTGTGKQEKPPPLIKKKKEKRKKKE